MIPLKKYFTDSLIQLAIVLSLLRTDLNHLINSGISTYPEVQEIMLGQSYAYTQTSFHSQNIYNTLDGIGHIHPKSVDNYFYNEVFQDIHRLNRVQPRGHEDFISAWLVDGESFQPQPLANTVSEPVLSEVNNNQAASQPPVVSVTGSEGVMVTESCVSNSAIPNPGSELTKEDMDLIEVLWHQDIDLGIGRDGFDSNLRQELEKEKELELQKKEEETAKSDENENQLNYTNYIVDGETGELIPSCEHTQQNNSSPLDTDEVSISIEDALQQLTEATQQEAPSNGSLADLLPQPNLASLLPQPNSSLADLLQTSDEQLSNQLDTLISQVKQNGSRFDRQTSVEQRWNDISSLLNLTNTNSSLVAETGITTMPTLVEEMDTISEDVPDYTSDVADVVSALSEANSALIQNASFAPQPAQTNYTFSQLIGLDSVSPAVTSPPTMINNTDPSAYYSMEDGDLFADVSDVINQTAFGQSSFLADIIDEGLDNEMAEFGLNSHIEHLQLCDVSDDSAVSSMGSLSPTTEEWNDTMSTVSSNGLSSPFDGLEGATGGSFNSSSYSSDKCDKQEAFDYSSSVENYELDSSDMEMNISSNLTTSYRPAEMRHVNHNHSYPLQPGQQPRERKTAKKDKVPMTRDQKRVKALKVPLTVEQIVNCPVDDFNDMLRKYSLNEDQMSLVRDIRRRGKNKVAAQNCRKRKMGVVTSLEDQVINLRSEKQKAMKERAAIDKEMKNIRDKYNQLYQEMFRSLRNENGQPYDPNEYSLQQTADGNVIMVPTNTTQEQQNRQRVSKKRKGSKKN